MLGPLLFNLFINDLVDSLEPNITAKLFADDLKLYSEFSNVHPYTLQAQLSKSENGPNSGNLKISHSKCSILSFGSKDPHSQFFLDGNCITQSDTVKDLGITIDSDFKFKTSYQ